ncbi:pyridoxal-phosphate dependent enzyme [bacterium]|nr:pyridoxal-phosphate dependent enzyme [bacterium]MCI0603964.1 pyridoxal-phosphate dependent enzyme [bacterium]
MNLKAPSLAEIEGARKRISSFVLHTPLVPMPGHPEIHLKLENLQPIGSFKIRGSGNAMELAGVDRLGQGVFTASAGNMAQGVAWNAKRLNVNCTSIVPENAPETKLAAIERLNGSILRVPYEEWWEVLRTGKFQGLGGLFIHPVSNPAVMAGNGTIGLEILEDLPDVQTIFIPYGGGGLSCGIAAAIRALKPEVKIYACEVETAAPLSAAWKAGEPCAIQHHASFVDGIGGKGVLSEMWPLASVLLDGSVVVTLQQICDAIRLLVERNRVVAEGAGAASLAAALASGNTGKVVCVISGGNIDASKLAMILEGRIP